MSSKTLGSLMRLCAACAAICGLFLCLYVIPSIGKGMVAAEPELGYCFWPWLIFSWVVAAPCFAILVFVWKTSGAVIRETVFTAQTSKWVKAGAFLLLLDAALLFGGNLCLGLFNMTHPGILLFSAIGAAFIAGLALFVGALSRYIMKAAILQEESEGTL